MSRFSHEKFRDGQYILLGEVGRPFGIKGEIRIHPYNPFTESFENINYIFLLSPEGEMSRFEVKQVRAHQMNFLLMLEGISDRSSAEKMRGWKVLVDEKQLPPCKEGEFYWFQLIGLKVILENGEEVGEVVRIEETNPYLNGNDILVLKSECQEVMIPFTKNEVKKVDLERGVIIFRSLEDFKE